jgi:hypothetical protein
MKMMPPVLDVYPDLWIGLLGWYLLGFLTGMAVSYFLLRVRD